MSETATHWHILTVTRGGTVSILKNLDAPTARQAYQRLRPDSYPREYINRPEPKDGQQVIYGSTRWYTPNEGDIEQVHILGPEGQELDPWKGVEPVIVDLSKAA